jgi:hypothetical protein
MLVLAFVLLCAAAAIGGGLAVLYLRRPQAKPAPPAPVLATHAALGAASLAVLLVALGRGLPPTGIGAAGLGPTAAALLAMALAIGLLLAHASWRRRRPGEMLVGLHAGLAVAGLVVLLALIATG